MAGGLTWLSVAGSEEELDERRDDEHSDKRAGQVAPVFEPGQSDIAKLHAMTKA